MEPQPAATTTPTQPDLPGLAEAFAGVGVESLPVGVANLTRKQVTFCLEYLRTGNGTEAARRAGYSSPESDGAKVLKNAGVSTFLARVAEPVAKNAAQLIIRADQRSKALHTLLMAELQKPQERQSSERVKWLTSRVDRTDMLLGSLLGKIAGINVSGEINHSHTLSHEGEVALAIPATALPVLAQMRRDATVAGLVGSTSQRN